MGGEGDGRGRARKGDGRSGNVGERRYRDGCFW